MSARIHQFSRYEERFVESLATPEDRQRLTPAAVKGFFKLADQWSLTDDECRRLLGDLPSSTYYLWKSAPPKILETDRLLRISYLLGIYKALNILFTKKIASDWMKLPNSNPIFGGKTPISVVTNQGLVALHQVRTLLDARRGGRA